MEMIIIGFAIIGLLWGLISASRRGGNIKDKCQYATVYGIAMALAGLFITIGLAWMTQTPTA